MDSRLQRLKEAQNAPKEPEKVQRRQRFTAQIISSSTTDLEAEKEKAPEIEAQAPQAVQAVQVTRQLTNDTKPDESDESDSEDDEELKKMLQRPSKPTLKPIFLTKEERNNEKATDKMTFSTSTSTREESRAIVADLLRREFEAAHLQKTNANAPDVLSGAFNPSFVDDSDDPNNFEEEYLSWKLRELLRIKDEKDEKELHDKEREEIERIRNMTEEERRKIDQEKMDEWMAQPKSDQKFLQKYYHKGSFYQEEHKEILSRDYNEATGKDRSDKDVLPEILQVRDFGKKGKGKWKHLTAEDTTAFDYGWGAKDNSVNFQSVSKMGGMKGDLDNPSKKQKK